MPDFFNGLLGLELMLNIAARRHDAHVLGDQHIRDGRRFEPATFSLEGCFLVRRNSIMGTRTEVHCYRNCCAAHGGESNLEKRDGLSLKCCSVGICQFALVFPVRPTIIQNTWALALGMRAQHRSYRDPCTNDG
jgi:hypothetical protein